MTADLQMEAFMEGFVPPLEDMEAAIEESIQTVGSTSTILLRPAGIGDGYMATALSPMWSDRWSTLSKQTFDFSCRPEIIKLMQLPKSLTAVTTLSKVLAVLLFILLPFAGFYLGIMYQKAVKMGESSVDVAVQKPSVTKTEFMIKKSAGNSNYPGSYKYELWKNDGSGDGPAIYSVVNRNGFGYDVTEDKKYIAILNYGESTGDETLTIIQNDGQVVKNFGHLDSPQSLVPFSWTEHFYWLSAGIPIGQPAGTIRVDADTLKVDRYGY